MTRVVDYWIPIVAFGVLTYFESRLPAGQFPIAYLVKAVVVTACLVVFRAPLADIHPRAGVIGPSMLLGLVVFVAWVAIDRALPYPHFGDRTAYDPTVLRGSPWWFGFLAVRLYGLVLMVPVMEELFWRSFLLRYLTRPDFRQVPVGTFSASALWMMVAGSALAHPEWLVAAIASLAYAFWLRRTRSLFAVIVAHGTTNAALGAYVLATGAWQYW